MEPGPFRVSMRVEREIFTLLLKMHHVPTWSPGFPFGANNGNGIRKSTLRILRFRRTSPFSLMEFDDERGDEIEVLLFGGG